MSDSIKNNLPRRGLGSLNRFLFRITVHEDVQLLNIGNPPAIDLPIKFDRELHSHSLTLNPMGSRGRGLDLPNRGPVSLNDLLAGSG